MRSLSVLFDMPVEFQYEPSSVGQLLASPTVEYGVMEGHQPRQGKVSWTDLSRSQFNYMMAFWRTATKEGSLNFFVSLPLLGGETDVEHLACFIGGLSIKEVTGGTASLSAQLCIIPRIAVYPLSAARDTLVGVIASSV